MTRFRLTAVLALALVVVLTLVASGSGAAPPRAPKGFFGIGPQTRLTDEDASYMKAGKIETIRLPIAWSGVQPTANGGYNWTGVDEAVGIAARHGLKVLPFIYATPRWVAPKPTTLPVDTAKGRQAWTAFLRAAVTRYGPGGEFWRLHAEEGPSYEPVIAPPQPIRTWQIWNEANFFYFAYPASPQRYARLLKLSSPAIKGADPAAKIVLTGLFGEPTAKGLRGMPSSKFLESLYRVPGLKSYFDGIALHPYAADTETLEELVERLHEVTVKFHDRVPLYITEMGWGSQNDPRKVAFEQGIQGQVKQLRAAYGYLLENRARLDLKQVYWFSWKDLRGSCSFCDSVGLFRAGKQFRPKPAWRAFIALSGGRLRP